MVTDSRRRATPPPMAGGPAESRRDRVAEVGDAARRVIVRKGLAATTMRDIAREGGFTTGVLTHYFPDKDSLIAGVFASASAAWMTQVRDELRAAGNARERLRVIVSRSLPESPEERRDWRLWTEMWNYAAENRAFAEHVVQTDACWEEELRRVLDAAVDERLLPELDARLQARILDRLIDGLGQRAVLNGRWDEAGSALIAHLRTLGLEPTVLADLDRGDDAPAGGSPHA